MEKITKTITPELIGESTFKILEKFILSAMSLGVRQGIIDTVKRWEAIPSNLDVSVSLRKISNEDIYFLIKENHYEYISIELFDNIEEALKSFNECVNERN